MLAIHALFFVFMHIFAHTNNFCHGTGTNERDSPNHEFPHQTSQQQTTAQQHNVQSNGNL